MSLSMRLRVVVAGLLTGVLALPLQAAVPDGFSFIDRTNVATQVFVTSEAVRVSGSSGPWTVSISGGNSPQLSINGGSYRTSGNIESGQTLRVRHVSSEHSGAESASTVHVGDLQVAFRSITGSLDRTPDPFSFGNHGNVAASTVVDSPAISLSGYNTPVPVVAGPGIEFSIAGGAYTAATSTLDVGQTLRVRHTSGSKALEYTRTYLVVGGVTGFFTTRTLGSTGPVAVNDRYSVNQGNVLFVSVPGVLTNDTSSQPLTAAVVNSPLHGALSLAPNGSFTYTPAPGYFGDDRFTYRTALGTQYSAPATVAITVVQGAQPPVRLTVQQFGSGAPGRTFSISPAGVCAVVTVNATYDCQVNTPFTVTAAVPPTGTYFSGWYETPECVNTGLDGNGTAAQPYRRTCDLVLNAPRTVKASFSTAPTPSPTAEADAPTCDVSVPEYCFFPFPNNVFTRAAGVTDNGSRTGLQINLVTTGRFPTPSTAQPGTAPSGAPLNPTEWNRNDGFSLNPKLITFIDADPTAAVAGLDEDDLDATGVPHLADLSRSLDADTPVLLINATPKIDANGNPCTSGAGCVANPEYLQKELLWAEPELPKRELRDTDNDGKLDTRVIPDAERSLTIRVGRNLKYRQRYIAALRSFKRADGSYIEAGANFRIFRDNQALAAPLPNLSARRVVMEDIFSILGAAGVSRSELNQAWDFTIISQENLHERLLHMRDTSEALLGATGVPCYTVENYPNASDVGAPAFGLVSPPYTASTCAAGVLPTPVPNNTGIATSTGDIVKTVSGTVAVPCFMTNNCAPGSRLNYLPATAAGESPQFGDNKPDQIPGSIFKANWQCRIPASATAANPARISLYGHGLLGGLGEVRSGHVSKMGSENNIIFCGMNWTGFATEDAGAAASVSADAAAFGPFIERQMQGHLNWIVLQELIVRPGGFINHPAFRTSTACTPVPPATDCPLYKMDFDADGNGGMFYDGNSQGGIMAGAVVALSRRITHAVLGVPGMNYSILLRRSSDYQLQEGQNPGVGATAMNYALEQSYPHDFDLAFIYSLSTMLWERTENAGFASNMTDKPLPNTPAHKFLLHPGFGDHQVSMWTNDIIARSGGMSVIRKMIDPAVRYKTNDPVSGTVYGPQKPYFGIPEITSFPFNGSALVVWDSGASNVDNPPLYNAPPRTKQDPHEHVRRTPGARAMKSQFMRSDQSGGAVYNTCAPGTLEGPCSSANHE